MSLVESGTMVTTTVFAELKGKMFYIHRESRKSNYYNLEYGQKVNVGDNAFMDVEKGDLSTYRLDDKFYVHGVSSNRLNSGTHTGIIHLFVNKLENPQITIDENGKVICTIIVEQLVTAPYDYPDYFERFMSLLGFELISIEPYGRKHRITYIDTYKLYTD